MAAKLLDHGAKANTRNRRGVTPLILAAEKGHDDLVALLLGRGADATLCDHKHGR